ncbi:aminopeptidase P family protein [bacterium]|nr:aminopeptidase P family protein [bacterium]
MDYTVRLAGVRKILAERGLQGCIVSNPDNIRYLSGFSAGADAWLFVSEELCALLTDGRYWAQAEKQCPLAELIEYRSHTDGCWAKCLAAWLTKQSWRGNLGFEGSIVYEIYSSIAEHIAVSGLAEGLVCLGGELDSLRIIKSAEEVALIREAAAVADRAWKATVVNMRAGMTESAFCAELEYNMKLQGSSRTSFDTIVASGPNGAYPHAGVTDRAIQEGELITVDFGAVYQGYCSDMTRTVWLGSLDKKSAHIYDVVKKAHDLALERVRPGLKGFEADKIARDVIAAAGFAEAFSHSLGHGVGLAVHEAPGLRKESQTLLQPGMLVTIEPGIYLPGVGGCRVEDLAVLTENGRDVLRCSPYQLLGQTHPAESFAGGCNSGLQLC